MRIPFPSQRTHTHTIRNEKIILSTKQSSSREHIRQHLYQCSDNLNKVQSLLSVVCPINAHSALPWISLEMQVELVPESLPL